MGIAAFILFSLFVGVYLSNRWNTPRIGELPVNNIDKTNDAGRQLEVTTWNIGFAALGANADLFIDGGKHLRALSRIEIDAAAENIAKISASFNSDVHLFQETAARSFLTRGVSVRRIIGNKMPDYAHCFWADLRTRFVPRPLNFSHGLTTLTKVRPKSAFTLKFPQDPLYYYGFLKKYYGGIVQRYPIKGCVSEWVVINIHLSAFDKGANVRRQQLTVLFEFAEQEFEDGHHVIIGGDWNIRLAAAEFPHTGSQKEVFEVYDFPKEQLPSGWTIVADQSCPSLRSLSKPYVIGENLTTIVDGFVVSPNVITKSVQTHDLGFEHTDHHPVTGRFSVACSDLK